MFTGQFSADRVNESIELILQQGQSFVPQLQRHVFLQNIGMDIAVGGMRSDMDRHPILGSQLRQFLYNVRNARHRHNRVFRRKNQTAGPVGFTERFSRLPDFHRVGHQDLQSPVRGAEFINHHALIFQYFFIVAGQRNNNVMSLVTVRQLLVQKFLAAPDPLVVHEFDANGTYRRLHDLGDNIDRILRIGKHSQQIDHMRRFRRQLDKHFGNNPQCSFGTDHQLRQAISRRILFQFAAEGSNFPFRRHHFQPQYLLPGRAVFYRFHSAGIGGHIAADAGTVGTAWFAGIQVPFFRGEFLHIDRPHPRFNDQRHIGLVKFHEPGHPLRG